MNKAIKITAIISFALEILYILVGRLIIPVITGIITSNRTLSFTSEPVKMLLIAFGFYFGMLIIGLIVPILYLLFMIAQIAASKTAKTGIAVEVLGIVVLSIVLPVLSTVFTLLALPFMTRMLLNWGSMDAYSIYNSMNASGSVLGILSTVALVLMIISFSFSICRKKWVPLEEFEEGAEE
ncbi:MAG: hypothetical protein J6X97_09575 [Lachnospiraceae bacterium]|nr:hypothetical protein [Lachnospiraceae bacterium]